MNPLKRLFNRHYLILLLLLVSAVFLVVYFSPREGQFRYHFQEGKPWRYGLLTASFDFPIYKSTEQVQAEQDSLLGSLQPYYTRDHEVKVDELARLQEAYQQELHKQLSPLLYKYVTSSLEGFYNRGIVSANEYDEMARVNCQSIRIIDKNIAREYPMQLLYTPRKAYETLLLGIEKESERYMLQNCDLSSFIDVNMVADTLTTNRVKKSLLNKIVYASGVVQAGERIVDRGEIVSPATYRILNSLQTSVLRKSADYEHRQATIIGQIIVVFILFVFFFLFLFFFRRQLFHETRAIIFLTLMIVGVTILTYLLSEVRILGIYMAPIIILPIVVRTFFDSRVSFYSLLITILLSAMAAPFALEYIFLQFIAGMAALFSLDDLVKRSQLVRTSLIVFLTYVVCYIGFSLYIEGDWTKINPEMFIYLGGSCIALLFAYLLIYLLERTFGFVSTVTLVELSDINSDALRRLSENCPGTFQHSLQVANLGAAAAIKIGANAQMVRTGALYHDIGKLEAPAYFTENQSGFNPHSQLAYQESAQIIIKHVKDGLRMADKLQLPSSVKDFIAMHHGKGITRYFYNSFRNEFPDKEIDIRLFSYPGPNPNTKETAVMMMADAVEAASHSLQEYTPEAISLLVNRIIDQQIADGMMRETPLRFRDIDIVKEVFIEKLKTVYHTRVSYPELTSKS